MHRSWIWMVFVALLALPACRHGEGGETDAGEAPDSAAPSNDAAETDAEPDTDASDASTTEPTWLKHDDGSANGSLEYGETPDEFVEYVRFEVEAPVEIRRLRATFDVETTEPTTVYLWDDFGGNGFNFDDEEPLAEATVDLDKSDDREWTEIQFDEPVELDPGRLFYAGIVVDGDEANQLAVDGSPTESDWPTANSMIWKSNAGTGPRGFPKIQDAPGDFLLRARIVRTETVTEQDHHFDAKPVGEVGLDSINRAAVADVDDDGHLDILANGSKLFLNEGDGTFRNATDAWLPDGLSANGGVFGDFDNDGDPDFFATGDADTLLEHRGDHFADVTDASGIDDTQDFECGDETGEMHAPTEASAWFDYDNDGWLDLYQANYHCGGTQTFAEDRLWHNQGDGTFEKVGLPVGESQTHAGRGVAPADADGDGEIDLFVTNYRLHRNYFLENRGGQLVPYGETSGLAGVGTPRGDSYRFAHSIGAAWGDVNADGALDVFVANLAHPRFIEFSQKSTLYINQYPETNRLTFENVTREAGIRYQETPSNPNLWDYDNDGDLDLFVTCIYDQRESLFYRNDGHPDWKEVSYETGLSVKNGWGSVVGDFDGDGALDLLARDKLFVNRNPKERNAVFVDPVGGGEGETNRSGIGARVRTEIDGRTILRERYGGHGTGVQDSPWLHVGLGDAESTDLTVEFPVTGSTVSVDDAAAGERIVVHEDGEVER